MRKSKKIITLLITSVIALSLIGCNKGPKEEVVDKSTQLGNLDSVDPDDIYVDNGQNQNTSIDVPDEEIGYPPISYSSVEEIPENTYAIKHINDDGSVIYYSPYAANGGYAEYKNKQTIYYTDIFPYGLKRGAGSVDYDRFFWVKSGYDESCIPTFYGSNDTFNGDKLIFKSSNAINDGFVLERFSDEGYTIGLTGLVESNSGNYMYSAATTYTEPDSDTVNIANLGAEEIYIVSVGKNKVDKSNVAIPGYITGLEKGKNYICDIRTGTQRKEAAFRANIHMFVCLEQYMISKFYFSDPAYIEIPFENSMPSGYYAIDGVGVFRYISAEDRNREDQMVAVDYNKPFITTDSEGYLISTIDGYAIDSNGYITRIEGLEEDTN